MCADKMEDTYVQQPESRSPPDLTCTNLGIPTTGGKSLTPNLACSMCRPSPFVQLVCTETLKNAAKSTQNHDAERVSHDPASILCDTLLGITFARAF